MGKTGETSAAATEDRISALPDDVLHLVLSCLPSDDAVRTSVLARRWRHQWKSAPAIRVAFRRRCGRHTGSSIWTPRTLTMFVNHLLLLWGYSPVDECDIRCGELDQDEDDYYSGDQMSACISKRTAGEALSTVAGMWIRHAVSFCKARVLKVSVRHIGNRLRIPDVPFVSENLTKVEIAEARLTFDTLDFSRCPALEVLEFSMSRIDVGRILRHLMMCLVQFIFRRDCQFCTAFGNLKTLLLNEWCMTPDFSTLVYFLRYTPVLEKLTLQLEYCDGRSGLAVDVTDEEYSPQEDFFVSKQLNVVEIKCQKKNELVGKLLIILQTHGVRHQHINIEQDFCSSRGKIFADLHHIYVY
ncbi:hypothetical protein HU200_037679 [Digitaria exilis]|uniref:F-box domain-containing protein n=1 Tax=Digitaria exilis TaxID=1010633 RepID=A0A835EMG7_9POAL|nr:hypothetical protein HU200_037679 [Digitaria exilis]